jgi:hypothetical protein
MLVFIPSVFKRTKNITVLLYQKSFICLDVKYMSYVTQISFPKLNILDFGYIIISA